MGRIGRGRSILSRATETGQAAIVEMLLEAGASVEGGTEPPLRVAAARGDALLVELLLEAGADVDGPGLETPLLAAASGGHEEVLEILLEDGADIYHEGPDGLDALHRAAGAGRRRAFEALATAYPKRMRQPALALLDEALDERRRAASAVADLIRLVREGKPEVVARKVRNGGVDVNEWDDRGFTLIFAAAEQGDHELIRLLAEAGARLDVRARNDDGQTPLIRAIRGRSPHRDRTAEFMAHVGSDIDQRCARGLTPLMHAVEADVDSEAPDERFAATTTALLRLGANLDATDSDGNTAKELTKRKALGARTSSARRRRLHQMLRYLETARQDDPLRRHG